MKDTTIHHINENSDQRNILHQYCSEEWHRFIDLNQIRIKIKKNGILFSEGEEVQGIYILEKGIVKLVSGIDTKKEQIFRLSSTGNIVGHRGLSAKQYPMSAVTLTDTELTFIPKNTFIKLLKSNSELCNHIINFLAEELRKTEERIKNRSQLDVKQYIGYIIIILIDTFGYDPNEPDKLSFTPSRRDFAHFAGLTYETTIRALLYLQNENLFKLKEKEICYICEKDLRKFVEVKL